MQRLKYVLTLPLLLWSIATQAQTLNLQAITDFNNLNSGEVPYYLDIAGDRNALAINAADPSYRNKFARAEYEYTGADGVYDITINALGEIDGDGMYRLSVNGIIQGVAVNSPVSNDYEIVAHTFTGIALSSPTIIGIESNAVSNNTIPEGDGFAFARGRWRSVTIEPSNNTVESQPNAAEANLGLSLSTIESKLIEGNDVPFIATVVNTSTDTTATNPVVQFVLPSSIEYISSSSCQLNRAAVECSLPEITPGASNSTQIVARLKTTDWTSITASVQADQADSDRDNNTSTLSFEVAPATAAPVPGNQGETAEPAPATEINATNMLAVESDMSDTINVGATQQISLMVLLLCTLLRVRATRPA